MSYSKKQLLVVAATFLALSSLFAWSLTILGRFSDLAMMIALIIIFSLFSIGTILHFAHIKAIIMRSIKNIEPFVDISTVLNEKSTENRVMPILGTLNTLTTYFNISFKNTMIEQAENQMKLRELERINTFKSHTLDTLLKVNHLFMDFNDSKDYYAMILASAIDVIANASKGSLLVYNPQIDRYEFQTCVGYDFEELKKVTMSLEETFLFKNSHGNYYEPTIIKNVREFDTDSLDAENIENIENAGGLDIEEALSSPIIIDGQIFAIINIDSIIVNAFDDIDKQLLHFFATQISIALKNKYWVDEAVNMSRYDKLTGAFNRNYFEKIITSHREASLENMESYSLVLCDLNYLKIINDTFGHSAGDAVLKEFSSLIHMSIRETDVLSRIGGDEFILLLRSITPTKAEEKMSQIFAKIKDYTFDHQGQKLPVSFSYGISSSPDDSMIYDILIKLADLRMYKFKDAFKKDNPEILSFINPS